MLGYKVYKRPVDLAFVVCLEIARAHVRGSEWVKLSVITLYLMHVYHGNMLCK